MRSKNERTASVVRPDAIIVAAVALLTMIMLACGGSKSSETREVEAAPVPSTTPVEVREPVETVPAVRRTITYAEAEEAYRERRYGEAVEMFDLYVRERTKNPFGFYMLGLSAWKSGEPERAESAFVTAIELDPTHVKSHLNLTRVLLDLGRADEGLERVRVALELDPESVDGHRLMGRVLSTLGRPAAAIESYRTALSIDSTDVWSMNNIGLMLIRQGRFEEALAPLAQATQLRPDVGIFQNNLGVALERTGRFSEAATAYRAAIESSGGHPTAEGSLARVESLEENVEMLVLSLEALALSFAEEVREWGTKRQVEAEGVVEP